MHDSQDTSMVNEIPWKSNKCQRSDAPLFSVYLSLPTTAYIGPRYDQADTFIIRAISLYCSDMRRNVEGRRKKDGPCYEWYLQQ